MLVRPGPHSMWARSGAGMAHAGAVRQIVSSALRRQLKSSFPPSHPSLRHHPRISCDMLAHQTLRSGHHEAALLFPGRRCPGELASGPDGVRLVRRGRSRPSRVLARLLAGLLTRKASVKTLNDSDAKCHTDMGPPVTRIPARALQKPFESFRERNDSQCQPHCQTPERS
jgi:hypothetical protein